MSAQPNAYRFGNFNDWRTDPALCANGVPYDAKGGRTLIVRRAGGMNRKLMVAISGISHEDEPALMRAYAEHVVVGWEGVLDADGEPIPYSPEACFALFEFAPELFLSMLVFVGDRTNYGAEKLRESKENVKT
jgi:hypothetical protein